MRQVRGTINAVQLLGWIGADPEMRFTPNGTAICKFRIATKHMTRRIANGEAELDTDWIQVEAWDRLAERCNTYLHKGSRILVSGNLRNDIWDDRETGQRRSRTFVRAHEVLFLDTRSDSGDSSESATVEAVSEESDEEVPF